MMQATQNQTNQQTLPTPWLAACSQLFDLLAAHQGERHIIALHAYPDPDAISCAFAQRLISAQYGIQTDIVYTGTISHGQNIALTRLLDLDLMLYEATLDLKRYDGVVYVDSQGTTCGSLGEALEAAGVPVLAVIDHHEVQGHLQPAFTDIRHTGATATIYAEYLENGSLQLSKANKDHVIVATALMHGIMTDTGNFVRAGAEDFHAASFLSQLSDANLLNQIRSQSRSKPTWRSSGARWLAGWWQPIFHWPELVTCAVKTGTPFQKRLTSCLLKKTCIRPSCTVLSLTTTARKS
jgi:nanoRNase/pAp phosphatase (c-di-AMP/oligoRNAs hydrolase)